MISILNNTIQAISGVLYTPFIIILLLTGGVFFTYRSRLVQFRFLPEALRVIMEKPTKEGSVSSFGALMVSTASRVGTGNIIGVSTAICIGGYGAVFWMWIIAILGCSSAFVESTLAQIYKKKRRERRQLWRSGLLYSGRPQEKMDRCSVLRVFDSDLRGRL